MLRLQSIILAKAKHFTVSSSSSLRLVKKRMIAMDLMHHSSCFLLPTIPLQRRPSLTTAQLHLCADGGANRLYDEMPLFFPQEDASDVRRRYKPDVIKGDMDSIRREVLEFYASLGTEIVDKSHDQDTTDLHKCVTYIRDSASGLDKSNLCILVVGALGGRFDHEMGNLNVICRFSYMRIVLLSNDSLIHLLPRTYCHEIHIQTSVEGPHCGLIPIGTPSKSSTTTGLQWDLNNTAMEFGGLVSTSNIVKEEKVTVQSDCDLLWTISIKKL
ncbi:hypothetical protein Goarm_022726 [Gossypium armourianum]|uniref:thiamine diphosphokinase n=1 Tax=Gossypium armourianum TaxID=34283 RepID=A0A7J9KHP5_9ROSI|nr:hypothetical protein [Gossypium armourianum]